MPSTHLIMDDKNNQLIILGHALKCKNLYRIGPQVRGRRAERGKVSESFLQVGGRRAESDKNISFYFPLGMPRFKGRRDYQ